MAINPEDHDTLVDRLMELFQSNEAAIDYGQDPNAWVDENLPEGTEPADVAGCLPEVTDRLGGPYQSNAAQYNAHHGASGQAATSSVVNEISYTYNTVYQQNAFIYAEEGAQVVNIQGDGNTVTQVDIDQDFGATHPEGWEDEYPEDTPPEDTPPEDGEDHPEDGEYPEDTPPEDGEEDPGTEEPPTEDPGWEDPGTEDPGHEEPPTEEPPTEDVPEDTPEDMPDM